MQASVGIQLRMIINCPRNTAMNILQMLLAFALLFMLVTPAFADEVTVYTVSIKDHKFDPAIVEIPSGKKAKLLVKNLDSTPEEFESHDLKREKIVPGNGEITVLVGPLKPGEYKFFGEFNEATAQGKIVVK